MTTLPLSIRDVKPYPLAYRITGERPDGLPDGFHTGGAWLYDGLVYKPLDGRPWANADCHVPTDEAVCLEEMAGEPLFPRNWSIEEHNGRRFLVRKKAIIVGSSDYGWKDLQRKDVAEVEYGIRRMTAKGWEVNDPITLGWLDKTLFLVDLSSAQKMTGKGAFAADNDNYLFKFFELTRWPSIKKLRTHAHHIMNTLEPFDLWRDGYRNVYASFYRSIDALWANIPGAYFIENTERPNWQEMQPHTWVVSQEPINVEYLNKYELTWGWSPAETEIPIEVLQNAYV